MTTDTYATSLTANITLNTVDISNANVSPFSIGPGATVNLTLLGNNQLVASDTGSDAGAGLSVPANAALDITSASSGSLYVAGGANGGAGIGGDAGVNGGTVTINGGTIQALGLGAGVGGGVNASGGTLTVTGGALTATGGYESAAIGGGTYGSGGTVTITGGTVNAKNGSNTGGAGIGGGEWGPGGTVVITGGTVDASGGFQAAGIGSGYNSYYASSSLSGGTVTIDGGTVTATGGYEGAGISGGFGKYSGGTVTISGGSITAQGGSYAPGIGGFTSGGTVTISGGSITAMGGSSGGAGIGGGDGGSGGTATINGGSVNASIQPPVYNSNQTEEYLVTVVPGTGTDPLPASTAVSYAVDGDASVSCTTDGSGKIYLWLPTQGSQTDLQIIANRYYYDASGTVAANDSNTFAANEEALASPTITSAGGATFVVGSSSTFGVATTGNPIPSLTENGALPSGVTFEDNGNGTATLGGTPSTGTAGSYPITITATNSASPNAAQSFTLTVSQAPTIASADATTFTVGNGSSFAVTTAGYPAPALTETGTLPSGVTFTDNGNGTATLSGTPAAGTGGRYPITFTAANGVSPNATQGFTLAVRQAPSITSAAASTFTVGTGGSFSVATTGYPSSTLTETGTLPSGVTFTDNGNGTGTLSGMPATGTAGSYPVTITATNSVSSTSQNFTLTTLMPISTSAISLPAPVAGATPATSVADKGQYSATVTWSPTVAAGGSFARGTQYTATITVTPDTGTPSRAFLRTSSP